MTQTDPLMSIYFKYGTILSNEHNWVKIELSPFKGICVVCFNKAI